MIDIQEHDLSATIKRILGVPAYERKGVYLYHGDCLEEMHKLPSGIIDLTITSHLTI